MTNDKHPRSDDIYAGVKITKLPPGRAEGADDLTNWSLSRSSQRSKTTFKKAKRSRKRKGIS